MNFSQERIASMTRVLPTLLMLGFILILAIAAYRPATASSPCSDSALPKITMKW
jgi:hypothetical protein